MNRDFPLAFCAYHLHLEFALLYPEDGFVLPLHLPIYTTYLLQLIQKVRVVLII